MITLNQASTITEMRSRTPMRSSLSVEGLDRLAQVIRVMAVSKNPANTAQNFARDRRMLNRLSPERVDWPLHQLPYGVGW